MRPFSIRPVDLNSVKDVANLNDEIISLVVTERLENGHTTANERLKNGRFAALAALFWMVGRTHIEFASRCSVTSSHD